MLSLFELHRHLQKKLENGQELQMLEQLSLDLSLPIERIFFLLESLQDMQVVQMNKSGEVCLTEQGKLANLDINHAL